MAWVARLETAVFGRLSEAVTSYGDGFTAIPLHHFIPMIIMEQVTTGESAFVDWPLPDAHSKFEMLMRNSRHASEWVFAIFR
jgi:hypothetical protein